MRPSPIGSLLLLGLFAATGCNSSHDSSPGARPIAGAVFVPTNEDQNRVAAYARRDDGTLALVGVFDTGGRGTAGRIVPVLDRVVVDPLFSQDSGVLSPDRRLFFVANAGDGTITSFRVEPDFSLTRADREVTGGEFPNSIAASAASVVYVSNVNHPNNPMSPGGTQRATITGFTHDAQGNFTPIPNSAHTLSSDASLPTHVLFNPTGDRLLVVELFAQTISVYPVGADGSLGVPKVNKVTVNPFALDFASADVVVSSDVSPPNMPGTGSASSYRLLADGRLQPITEAVMNGKITPCWVTVTPGGRFAYVSSTDDGTVSLYSIANGVLALVNANAATKASLGAVSAAGNPTSGPVDTFVTPDGALLYQQFSGRGSVVAYRIADDGSLAEVGEFGSDRLPMIGAEGVDGF